MNTTLLMLAADASAFENMTFADRVSESLRISLLGMGMVFAVLAVLWLVLEVFRYVFYDLQNKGKHDEKKPEKPAVKAEPAPAPAVTQVAAAEDTEIVAAITAALCVMLDKPATGFRVVSFRKTGTR